MSAGRSPTRRRCLPWPRYESRRARVDHGRNHVDAEDPQLRLLAAGVRLRRLIESVDDDVTVSFVDFRPGQVLVQEQGSSGSTGSTGKVRRAFSKVVEYNEVDAKLVRQAEVLQPQADLRQALLPDARHLAAPNHDLDLDVQVIGSDEVFNCVQSNTNVGYARELFGHGSPAAKADLLRRFVRQHHASTRSKLLASVATLRTTSPGSARSPCAIGTRRGSSKQLTGRLPDVHVDPVLAYDFMALEEGIPRERQLDGKYLIVYGYPGGSITRRTRS